MTKFKIILAITVILILVTSFTLFLSQSKNKPVNHAAIKVVLGQTPDYKLSLKSLSVEDAYSSDYKLAIPFGHYEVKIIGKNEVELFSGKVEKNKVIFPPYEIEEPSDSTIKTTMEPLSEITVFLSYFTHAKKVVFLDEKNIEKLQVDIENLSLPQDITKKLCGNGICDSNENIFFCYKDCRPR